MIALKVSGPSLGGLATGVSPGRTSVESEGRSAGLIALRIASSRNPSDQNGFQLEGPRAVGGPEGRTIAPAAAGMSSIARRPALSGVFSDTPSSLMAPAWARKTKKRVREPQTKRSSAQCLGS